MERGELLEKAKEIVTGERQHVYGQPENTFEEIANLWSSYLDTKIDAEEVAVMMILMKVARLKTSGCKSVDSWVDVAGYAACGAEIATMQKEEEL